jgi:phosphate transport system substrate-binding protein
MNDDFLQKIRIEPPPRFIAALKARLDRQSGLRRTNRTWFRHSLMAAVIGASGLAAAVMVVNSIHAPTTNTNAILHALRPTAGGGSRGTPQVSRDSAGTISAEQATAPSPNPSAARPDANLTSMAASPVQHALTSSTGLAPEGMRILGPASLSASLKEATRILNLSRPFSEPAFSTASSDSAIAALCSVSHASEHTLGAVAGTADAAGATRRISSEELKRCEANGIRHVVELKLGYRAIVLARSKLYPVPKLTARDLFLALAAKIPDPDQPQKLIDNRNTSWSQINPALPDERIDIVGPSLDSDTTNALREFLLEPGCSTFPSLASLKEKDRARYDGVCKGIRTDGIYHGMNSDLFGQLEAHPEVLALVDFRYFAANDARLIGVSIEGVEPTSTTVYAGGYPGSRALYLYANVPRILVIPRMREFILALQESSSYGSGSTLIPGNDSDRRESRQAALALPDVKL